MTTSANETGNARAAQTPQFLNKLSAMVDDPATDRFIKWADDGNSFYVFNPDQFAKELLGTYYKTDASASFVRQLNMYGFHKVPHVRQGALKSDKQAQAWHYRNPNFRRGRPDLLPYITRKGKAIGGAGANTNIHNLALQPIKQPDLENDLDLLSGPLENGNIENSMDALTKASHNGELAKGSPKSIDMSQIINGLATIKRHQTLISDNLKELQSSNQALWQEAMEARERHRKHQETINRILKFLASLFQGSATPIRSASLNSGKSSSSDGGPTVVPRPRLMIKDVQDREEDHEDSASTPRSSVRMEEIELLDDDIPPTKSASVETPKTPSTDKNAPTPIPQANSPPQYPFVDQGQILPNGTYIPPADTWKMLQWLQQNQIPIPGVSYPPTNVNAGALTTMPPSGIPFNQLAFANALAEMSGAGSNFNVPNPAQPGQNGNPAASWPTTYAPPAITNQQQQQPNDMASMYQNPNQFLNTLLPLASMTNERPPDLNMAQVTRNGDKIDQLSNHVQAMEQGIDSIIEGMGLDPMSAASLRAQQNANMNNAAAAAAAPFSMEAAQPNQQQSDMLSMANGLPTGMDPYQTNPSDFDLDELLKHLGAAAAASTPPALHTSDGFPDMNHSGFDSQLNPPFDTSMFNDVNMNMYGQNPNGSQFYGLGDGAATETQDQQARQPQEATTSSGYLNEINSPEMTRADSAEPRADMDVSKSPGVGRGRTKKRKQSAAESTSGDGVEMASPIRATSKGTGRASKRRK